ncbi:hypothetical protein LINPERPRIM_LOCUS4675, partial [Linum perenne]
DVLGQNSKASIRLSLSFQLEVVGELGVKQQLLVVELGVELED